ncbi:MAG: hypothetical protein FWD11_04075 [Micrococcales bacterium]|nr:hypothetical protein [Micrococcales bacterium]
MMIVVAAMGLVTSLCLALLLGAYGLDYMNGKDTSQSAAAWIFAPLFFLSLPTIPVIVGTAIWAVVAYVGILRGRYIMTKLSVFALMTAAANFFLALITYGVGILWFWGQ